MMGHIAPDTLLPALIERAQLDASCSGMVFVAGQAQAANADAKQAVLAA